MGSATPFGAGGAAAAAAAGSGWAGSGAGNGVIVLPASAGSMTACQIWAGYEPPVTLIGVAGGIIDRCRSGKPTQTALTRSGVYPTNQASRHSLAVPVLPATGRSPSPAAVPVPRWTTWVRMPVTPRATSVGMARCSVDGRR